MKLNYYEAWHYHYIAEIEKPFKLWIMEKPQGKMKFFGEVMKNRMYDVPEADDNEEFQKWLLGAKRKESAETQPPKALIGWNGEKHLKKYLIVKKKQ